MPLKKCKSFYTFGTTSLRKERPITRHTGKHRLIPMQWMAFRPIITAFQQYRTVHNSYPQWLPNDEMGGACSACGGEERCIQGFGGET
jgi:hypothetical protein